ncbi:helix-turn-helix domain-containing protein [Streptomyces jeddahensis]|uniref:Insertion element IS150 protein InsJ-like helix-turn-helix domain-containing protein n=1 Tax=Streptomyces jeddahensis TaxID=1716141 RepID=A0A177HYI3_9ACTN|nr:hypothetical protein STSP_12610 [Streptomyces jeddahensis]
MASSEDEDRRRAERARQVGLFRYSLIQDLLDTSLTTPERGRLARELAEREHTDPFGRQVRVSRGTIDRWTRDYRCGGFAALVPEPRKAVPRTPPEVLELAAGLKRENPARTAAQIQRILRTTQGWSPTERTLQRHFVAAGLTGTGSSELVPTWLSAGVVGVRAAIRSGEAPGRRVHDQDHPCLPGASCACLPVRDRPLQLDLALPRRAPEPSAARDGHPLAETLRRTAGAARPGSPAMW